MAITVKHSKTSSVADAGDATLVQPSDWNADHTLTGTVPVANGGTGAATLTGYVKGNGTAAMTAAATIPSTDVTGLGTMSTQNANAVAITGGAIDGTTIGATTTSTGKFTTLNASTSLTTPIVQASNSGGLSLKNSAGTTQISMGAGGGDNASINVSTNINGTNAQIDISPTGTGHVHINPTGVNSIQINPTYVGTMDNMTIGATTPKAITGTTITATTFSGSGASLTSIPNSALVNSAITINGTSTSLGGSISVGTVTSVGISAPAMFTVSGSPVTSSGTLALSYSGTALPLANGGTGQTTATAAFNALAPSQTANTGKYLTTDGTNTSWASVGGNAYTRTSFTATAAQTTFTVAYTVGYVEVFVNGVLLNASDYTASNGTSVVLSVACNSGDIVETIAFTTFNVANTVSSFSGGSTGLTPSSATTGAVSLAGTLAVANGGTGLTTAGSAGQVLTTDGTTLSYGSSIVSGTSVATTSGTAVTFTSIPSWVKRITMVFNGVSTNGSSYPVLRIGSGSVDSTSYVSSSTVTYGPYLASITSTSSYVIYTDVAANALSGSIELNNVSGNIWIASGVFSLYAANGMVILGGTHTISGTLDRVQLTTINGTDTFDAGSVNILYG